MAVVPTMSVAVHKTGKRNVCKPPIVVFSHVVTVLRAESGLFAYWTSSPTS